MVDIDGDEHEIGLVFTDAPVPRGDAPDRGTREDAWAKADAVIHDMVADRAASHRRDTRSHGDA